MGYVRIGGSGNHHTKFFDDHYDDVPGLVSDLFRDHYDDIYRYRALIFTLECLDEKVKLAVARAFEYKEELDRMINLIDEQLEFVLPLVCFTNREAPTQIGFNENSSAARRPSVLSGPIFGPYDRRTVQGLR